jgi:uncharacterized protein (TIGR00369 family)
MSPDHHRKLENMYHAAPVNELYQPRLEVSEGRSVVHMAVDPRFHHGGGALHGSAYFKALDDAAYFAVNSLVDDCFVLTVSFNLYLLRPVVEGQLRAEGRVTSATSNLFVAESVLYLGEDTQVARGSGTFQRSRVPLTDVETYR